MQQQTPLKIWLSKTGVTLGELQARMEKVRGYPIARSHLSAYSTGYERVGRAIKLQLERATKGGVPASAWDITGGGR